MLDQSTLCISRGKIVTLISTMYLAGADQAGYVLAVESVGPHALPNHSPLDAIALKTAALRPV